MEGLAWFWPVCWRWALSRYTGVPGIVTNAVEVIFGNQLDGQMAQREVDHLNWANQVNALLTNDAITTLEVQLDDHECAFGKWLYGEERKKAEEKVPALAALLKEIEEPHRRLHESARLIGDTFKQADTELLLFSPRVKSIIWNGSPPSTIPSVRISRSSRYKRTITNALSVSGFSAMKRKR